MCCEGPFGEPLACSHFVSLGDMVLLRRPIQRHTHCSISSPTSTFPSVLCALEQKAISRPFGDSPIGFDDLQAFISLLFSAALFLLGRPLRILSRWAIWYCFTKLFGGTLTASFYRQLDLFLQGSAHHLVPSCQVVSMLCLKLQIPEIKDFHQILRQNMHLRTLFLSKYIPK
ncbi:hypothetical protein H5410_030629 [Solanum commersonii]|uniref:Uncharacterized protein n=1 Tax=Solanum commersonii TaxID=4109 RepID=A0A9J5YEU4_SOLCO|nr:hypothetical protein H5410_030629 [Solanum commersonii]